LQEKHRFDTPGIYHNLAKGRFRFSSIHKKRTGTLRTIDFQLPLAFGDPESGFAVGTLDNLIVHEIVDLLRIQSDDRIVSDDKSRNAPEPSGCKFSLGRRVLVDIFWDK
jgi:hypothetical protein